MARDPGEPHDATEEPPPWFRRWGALYAIVVAELILLIGLLAWLTRAFA